MCDCCMYVSCVSVTWDMRHHVCLLHVCIMFVCYMRYEASHVSVTCMYHVYLLHEI